MQTTKAFQSTSTAILFTAISAGKNRPLALRSASSRESESLSIEKQRLARGVDSVEVHTWILFHPIVKWCNWRVNLIMKEARLWSSSKIVFSVNNHLPPWRQKCIVVSNKMSCTFLLLQLLLLNIWKDFVHTLACHCQATALSRRQF